MPRIKRQEFPTFKKETTEAVRFFHALPKLAGNTALNFFKDSWNREAFIDTRPQKWAARSNDEGSRRRLLVASGRLRRSLRMQYTQTRITISTDVPYAQIHNEGGPVKATVKVRAHKRRGHAVKAHTRQVDFTMPKRQFMGASQLLNRRIERLVTNALNQIF